MHFKKFIAYFFSKLNSLIFSECFLEKHRLSKNFFTRNRKLSFAEIIQFILRIPQKTLSHELSNFVSEQLAQKRIQRISKQAFSSARQKISSSAFAEILDFTYHFLTCLPSSTSNWHGYTVKAIDGTTIRVPNTKQNREYFQTQKNQYGEAALLKASALYDVSRDFTQKVALGSCRTSEKVHAIELLTRETLHDEYQANRNFLIGQLKKTLLLFLRKEFGCSKQLDLLLFLAQKERSLIRPDRKWKRIWHSYGKTTTYCNNQRTAL